MAFNIIDNPFLKHKLSLLRSVDTPSHEFRQLISEISAQIFCDAAKSFQCEKVEIETPFASSLSEKIEIPISLIPVMRAGNGMLESILKIWPTASVGHIGIYRDKFLNHTVEYYFKMPNSIVESKVFILDPIIATGETAMACVDRLKEIGCKDICFLCILTTRNAQEELLKRHPDVEIYAVSDDDEITSEGYLTPGIGDFGARYYNTK